jgi:predicted DNA-binding WGR domain protein
MCRMLEAFKRPEDVPGRIELKKVDATQNMHRFYRMSLQHDLFGNVSLLREWGRIGSCGQIRVDTYEEEAEAVKAMIKLATEKQRRGYKLARQKTSSLAAVRIQPASQSSRLSIELRYFSQMLSFPHVSPHRLTSPRAISRT